MANTTDQCDDILFESLTRPAAIPEPTTRQVVFDVLGKNRQPSRKPLDDDGERPTM